MKVVACSGFPGPVSRYWSQFAAVEITETELGIPGDGTVRRWLRESPKGFVFTLRAPGEFAASGFAKTNANKSLLADFAGVATQVRAKAVVFRAEPTFKATPKNRRAVKLFLSILPADLPPPILDLPAWKTSQVESVAGDRADVAYDPLLDDRPQPRQVAYVRLPGPAGRRSRYDDESVDRIATHVASLGTQTVFCVFRNVDMEVNAKALMKALA